MKKTTLILLFAALTLGFHAGAQQKAAKREIHIVKMNINPLQFLTKLQMHYEYNYSARQSFTLTTTLQPRPKYLDGSTFEGIKTEAGIRYYFQKDSLPKGAFLQPFISGGRHRFLFDEPFKLSAGAGFLFGGQFMLSKRFTMETAMGLQYHPSPDFGSSAEHELDELFWHVAGPGAIFLARVNMGYKFR